VAVQVVRVLLILAVLAVVVLAVITMHLQTQLRELLIQVAEEAVLVAVVAVQTQQAVAQEL
jgi:hypothetical protein